MIERKIKDLSIALEALTRVQGVENEFNHVKTLLNEALTEAYKEYPPSYISPPRQANLDDDIPF